MRLYLITVNKNGKRLNFFRKGERAYGTRFVWEKFIEDNPEMSGYPYEIDYVLMEYIRSVE